MQSFGLIVDKFWWEKLNWLENIAKWIGSWSRTEFTLSLVSEKKNSAKNLFLKYNKIVWPLQKSSNKDKIENLWIDAFFHSDDILFPKHFISFWNSWPKLHQFQVSAKWQKNPWLLVTAVSTRKSTMNGAIKSVPNWRQYEYIRFFWSTL